MKSFFVLLNNDIENKSSIYQFLNNNNEDKPNELCNCLELL